VCSLEVPDIAQGVASHFESNTDVVVLLANAGNTAGTIEQFLTESGSALPSLMDQNESLYRAYDVPEHFAPFPRHIVVDQTGVIRYLSGNYDALMVQRAIQQLLD
jgi:hypothetical protein